jgi:hypothetical protein
LDALLIVGLVALVVGLVFAVLGRYVATQKHREPNEGAMLGFLFGPLGVLIEALLPSREPPKPKAKRRLSRSGWQPPVEGGDGFDEEVANWLRPKPGGGTR